MSSFTMLLVSALGVMAAVIIGALVIAARDSDDNDNDEPWNYK